MDWVEKLPSWAIGVSLAIIAAAFLYIIVARPPEFIFAGLKFGANDESEQTIQEVDDLRESLVTWTSSPPTFGNQSGRGDPKEATMCPDGHYAAGINWWGSPGSTRYCIGCLSGIQVICRQLNVE